MQPRALRNMMPASCCGEADAYWADAIEIDGDKIYAVITDDRDDGPLKRQHVDSGSKYFDLRTNARLISEICQRAIRTRHAILFLASHIGVSRLGKCHGVTPCALLCAQWQYLMDIITVS